MINSEDTKIIKKLVLSALLEATLGDFEKYHEIKPSVELAFNILINEMEQGNI